MSTLFSFASWNVEHFRNNRARIRDNIAFLAESSPDVFGIFEVEGRDVFQAFVELMPSHHIFITEDLTSMQTLVGVNRSLTSFVTQRQQFKSDIPTLRPGSLVTLTIDGNYYSILFLHLKSWDDPRSWGLRDDMIGHVRNLKQALDEAPMTPGTGAHFICMGDLNTMGMNLTYSPKDMSGTEELARYVDRLGYRTVGLRLLSKSHEVTWWNGQNSHQPPSNLDHVFASNNLEFTKFGDAEIDVRGWPQLPNNSEMTDWINTHSDHALLYGEVRES